MIQSSVLRVLVVDDRIDMAETVAESLAERGYEAIAIDSGREALSRLRHERFDAVVTDLRMPGVDGLGVLEASRALDPRRPVIIMTGHGAPVSALDAAGRGAYQYLMKPFRMDVLSDLLSKALRRETDDPSVRKNQR